MKYIRFVVTVAVVFACIFGAGITYAQRGNPLRPGMIERTLTVDGIERHYRVNIPVGVNLREKLPVVLFFHGFGGTSLNGLEQGKWIEKSEQEKFFAVGLDGVLKDPEKPESFLKNQQSWNSGIDYTPSAKQNVDDVKYTNAVIDDLIALADGKVDEKRIFASGFSNGAGMTFRVGVELADRIAAIAPVSNMLLVSADKLSYPVSLLLIFGTADPIVPITGAKGAFGKGVTARPSAEESWQTWAKLLNCTDSAPSTIYDKDGVKGMAYTACDGGAEPEFYTVKGMGHAWPGGRGFLPATLVGPSSNAINATDIIWTFFMKHPRP